MASVDQTTHEAPPFAVTSSTVAPQPMQEAMYRYLVGTAGRDSKQNDAKTTVIVHAPDATCVDWEVDWLRSAQLVVAHQQDDGKANGTPALHVTDRDNRAWTGFVLDSYGWMIALDVRDMQLPLPSAFVHGCVERIYVPSCWMPCASGLAYLWFASTATGKPGDASAWCRQGGAHGLFAFPMVPCTKSAPVGVNVAGDGKAATDGGTSPTQDVPGAGSVAQTALSSASTGTTAAPAPTIEGAGCGAAVPDEEEDEETIWTEAKAAVTPAPPAV